MVRQKDTGHAGAGRSSAAQKLRKKNRHYNDRDRPQIPGLVARPALPKSKHKTILEWTENTDKKKKLEIEFTTNKNPNANFSFVPIGNPDLTSMCKELSRERGALVYIVSTTKEKGTDLSDHVHRIGYHFRTHIVEQAATVLEGAQSSDLTGWDTPRTNSGNKPDPIPESQEEINKQADAAIRDLFPRIPNTDREMIVRHAFQKGAVFNGKPVVGLQADLTLSRRVQLAVIAHIRHTHTRYDLLLKETSWENARRTVESLCLDILVKWRGDEETGRDQLDEVLREIVVIDDSDDEDDDEESEEGSASEDEEADSSDGVAHGVAAVNLDTTKPTPIAPQEPLPESQITQVARILTNNNPQIPNQIDSSHQNQGISSRTRSKTKPNHRQKTKKSRRNKRFQAWQDALRRRGERPSAPRTPFEQPSRTNVRELDESPRLILNRTPVGPSNLDLYTAPYSDDYQTIYAIDNGRGPSRSATYITPSRRITGPPEFNYREKMLISPQTHAAPPLEHRRGYDAPRPLPSKPLPFHTSGLQQSYTPSLRDLPSEDMALPSIESPMDPTNESPRRVNTYRPMRHSQVTYQEVEPERRYLPTHTDTTYVSNWEDNQPKRRRIVLADDRAHVPISSSTTDGYIRVVPISRSEQPDIAAPPLRRVVEVRAGRARHDVPTMIDQRPEHPRYIQRVAETRDQNGFSSMTDMREPTGIDRERRLIIDGDSPPHVRMVRRPPRPNQSYSGHQYTSEPPTYESARVGDRHYFETSRPTQSMQDQFQEHNRRVDTTQPVQQVLYARAPPRYQHEVEQDSSTSLSTFPSHPHSSEVNSGLVSYPILSRHHEYDSRFPSTRDEPILVGTKTSHQFSQERFAADNFERQRPQGRGENRRPIGFEEVSRGEQRYFPADSQARMQEIEPQYIPIDPPDMVRRIVRQRPTNAAGLNEPTYVRKLPHRDEIIVLSP